ncbi:MAG: GNAT family N-acetyltransferase [Melioribacteraceae bacterium]
MLDGLFISLPKLETERLFLRKLEYADKRDIFEYANIPESSKYLPWDVHESEMDTLDFLNITYDRYNNDKAASWGIELKSSRKIIGTAGFATLDKENFSGEIGYVISKDFWDKGYATEAGNAILKFGFEQMQLNRIEARCHIDNKGSARVLEKLGMSFAGILRKEILMNEEFADIKIYSILSDEY